MNLNKYEVTWLLTNGTKEVEVYEAQKMEMHPSGLAVFFNIKDESPTQIHLARGEQAPPDVEIIGSVSGFNKIKKV